MFWRGLLLAGGLLAIWVPGATAAAPANDDFANAQVLSGALPIEVSATNVEATKEEGEPVHGGLGSKGHSVWFNWEATVSGYVTVGTCGSDFGTVMGVYTGSEVGALSKVAGDFSSEGPGCPGFDGREVTFKATSGTTYELVVDGDAFYLPPAEPPLGEGSIELQLSVTPTPTNDDFGDAPPVTGLIEEGEGAEKAFYWASVRGFNWNATKQEGEPDHAGDQGGASVWYAWTAPGSGSAQVSACGGGKTVVAAYVGDSVDALTPVGSQEFGCGLTVPVTGGTTYRIAVDGKYDSGTGEPALGTFSVLISMQLPLRPHQDQEPIVDPPPPRDTIAPDTTIGRKSIKPGRRKATFAFASTEPGSTFRCRFDRRKFVLCASPQTYRGLGFGLHAFRVVAVDGAGNVDASPAVVHFSVPRPPRRP